MCSGPQEREASVRLRVLLALGLYPLFPVDGPAQDWAARFPPDPRCQTPGPISTTIPGPSRLRVILTDFDGEAVLRGGKVKLALRGSPDTTVGAISADSLIFDNLLGGDYQLFSGYIGYYPRMDSLRVAKGHEYILRLPMTDYFTGLENKYNCRPRGFRRPGETACVTSGEWVDHALGYAVDLSRPEGGQGFGLPRTDPTQVKLVTDESICERAGRHYGKPTDPPRRVIVVRMDTIYMVYDPFEPERGGEWTAWSFFDSKWKLIAIITG